MAAPKLFIVVKNDTVIQATSYIVRAYDETHAKDLVDSGMYIEETKPETLDTIDSETVNVEELDPYAEGQSRK
jgi:hypothetical protein